VAVVVSVTPQIPAYHASCQSARKNHKATASKVATQHTSSNSTKKQNTKQHQCQSSMSSFAFDEDMTEVDTLPAVFDVLDFATDTFINALVDDTDQRHELSHFINERVIFFWSLQPDCSRIVWSVDRASRGFARGPEGGVCIVEVFWHGELSSPPSSGWRKKEQAKDKRESKTQLARNLYLIGITHKRILEHGIGGGGPADTGSHEGRRWKHIYGFPFDLFVDLSNEFEAWLIKKGKHTYLKDDAPFKLRVVACFHQLRLGGPLHQHREGCGLVTTVFRFFLFLSWLAVGHQDPTCENTNN
jgi:hypothetical protein